jgi:hypothetical protein
MVQHQRIHKDNVLQANAVKAQADPNLDKQLDKGSPRKKYHSIDLMLPEEGNVLIASVQLTMVVFLSIDPWHFFKDGMS